MSYRDDLALKLETYSPEQISVLIFEAIIENMEDASQAMKQANKTLLDEKIDHNREILAYLLANLDPEYPKVANASRQIYLYVNQLMTEAVIRNKADLLVEAAKILVPMKEGWEALSRQLAERKNEAVRQNKKSSESSQHVYTGLTYGKEDINISGSTKDWDKG